ncbi:FprA family A-type flavoprotein [Candidatus Falkowbacteria bacterium]|nr:FprA family A-type flavoprotein [Candidatus Falkowbacteria bacterium]
MQEIKNNIFSVGANDPDRKFFDTLIPLPFGTSYNSYVVKGSLKTALIDTVDPEKSQVLLDNLAAARVDRLDYIVVNHAEQDHSGSLPLILEKYPEATILCSDKCQGALADLLHISGSRVQVVKDKDTINLGDKTLEFIYTPWVHWAETMVTYLKEDKILFSCDFFGAHLAADDLLVFDKYRLEHAVKIYFAEIMMPFRLMIKSNLAKLESYPIDMIAPSHGPIHSDVGAVLGSYRNWIADESVKNLAVVAYISMHGSTKMLADRLKESLEKNGVEVRFYDISKMDIGELAVDMVDAATFVIGTPCLLGGIHPGAANLLYLANALRPKTRFVSVIGSYGWSGGMAEAAALMIKNLKVEVISPVIVKGMPSEDDLKNIDKLAQGIAQKHKELNHI